MSGTHCRSPPVLDVRDPIIFPQPIVPERWQWTSPSIRCRHHRKLSCGVAGAPIGWSSLAFAAVIACAILVYGAYSFRRFERKFADFI